MYWVRKKEPLTDVFYMHCNKKFLKNSIPFTCAIVYLSPTERGNNVVRISVINFTAAIMLVTFSLFPSFDGHHLLSGHLIHFATFNKQTGSARTFPRVYCDAAFMPCCQPCCMLGSQASEGNCKFLYI